MASAEGALGFSLGGASLVNVASVNRSVAVSDSGHLLYHSGAWHSLSLLRKELPTTPATMKPHARDSSTPPPFFAFLSC